MKLARLRSGRSPIGGLIFLGIAALAVIWAADRPGEVAVFSGRSRQVTDEFDGADITAVFGGQKLDLREATMRGGEAVLHVTTIFGGAEILVPDDWNVVTENATIFGGLDDKTHHRPASSAPKLIIEGATIFGGLEIKN